MSRIAREFGNELFALPESVYVLLRDLVVERTGVLFDAQKRELLADKLSPLVADNGLTSFLDYYYLLRYDDPVGKHLAALLDRLAVPETFFWRQSDQLEAFARIVAPAHIARHVNRPLRVWSAACCSGEEPISIAIALAEAGLLYRHPIEIVATDGSSALVERARRGLFGERAFRQMPPELRERYFVQEGHQWRVDGRIAAAIEWGTVNLIHEAEVRARARADVIFCRNVFIYFADDAVRHTVGAIADSMPSDGYLFLGAAESLTRLGTDLDLVEVGDAFGYVKSAPKKGIARTNGFAPKSNSSRRSAT